MKQTTYSKSDWKNPVGRYWSTFFNCISGPRTVVMIGTSDQNGVANLGLFNSLVHIGANPPLLAFILRPTTVARHTYENIKNTGSFTINHGTTEMIDQVHQTSAKYPADTDEFDTIGLEKEYFEGFRAPFVSQSPIKLGLTFREEHLIASNDTRLIVGEVEMVKLNRAFIQEDGFIRFDELNTLLSCGLDAYHKHEFVTRKPYARPQ